MKFLTGRLEGLIVIRFSERPGADLDSAIRREWLETNGLGGFANSTIVGMNTRRYHGLLTAAICPPVGRVVLPSKLEETLVVDGQRFELSCNQYPGVVHPEGHLYLAEFRLDPFPVFVYRVAAMTVEKRVFMVQGENTTVVQYELLEPDNGRAMRCELEVRPLIAFRDYHSLTHRNEAINRNVQLSAQSAIIEPYLGLPELHFAHDAATACVTGD